MGLDRYLTQKAPGMFWVAVGEILSLSPTPPASSHHRLTSVLLCHLWQRPNKVNDHRTFLLLEIILPRMKLVYISRGALLVVFLHQFHKCALVFRNSHCHGKLSVDKQALASSAPHLCLWVLFIVVLSLKTLEGLCCGSFKSW